MAIPADSTLVNLNRQWVSPSLFPLGFVDQFIRKIPFQRLEQSTSDVKWNRLTTPPPLPLPAPYAADGTLTVAAVDATVKSVTLRRIGDTALVDYFAQITSGDPNELLAVQVQAKKTGVIRNLGLQIISGSGVAPNLNGLVAEVDGTTQTIAVSGMGLPTLDDLHRLVHTVRPSDGSVGGGGADCLMTHERVVRYIMKLLEDSAGGTNSYIYDPDLGVPVPHIQGIPIYIGQVTEDKGALDIWGLKFSGPTGVRVLHGGGSSEEFGLDVIPVPMQTTKSQLGAFVGGFYALMVPEPQSIARLTGTTTAALTTAGVLALP